MQSDFFRAQHSLMLKEIEGARTFCYIGLHMSPGSSFRKRLFCMKLDVQSFDLKLTTPFRIARHVQYTAANVLARITHEGVAGIGEAAPSEHYGENRGTVLAALALLADELGNDPFAIEDILKHINHIIGLNPSAKAAIDM